MSGFRTNQELRLHTPDKLFPPSCRANKNNEFTRLCFSGSFAAIINSLDRASLGLVNLRPVFAASASATRCAARIGSADDKSDRADSETGDRAKERRCATPKIHRSIPRACPATVASPLARRLGRNNGSRTAHWASVMSMFSIYAIGHKFQLLSPFKVFWS